LRAPFFGRTSHVIKGETLDGEAACCVVKIGPTGKVVIITAWVEEGGHAV